MGIITAKAVTSELQTLWPALWDVWPMDKEFFSPTYEKVLQMLDEVIHIRKISTEALAQAGIAINTEYMTGAHDCDNFALELQADISRLRMMTAVGVEPSPGMKPWSFGTACCIRTNGRDLNHTLNICRTSDTGYVFIEPQDHTHWVADTNQDTPYFIEMR